MDYQRTTLWMSHSQEPLDGTMDPPQAETLLDAELISRCGVPPSQHRWRVQSCLVARSRQPGPLVAGTLTPRLPIGRVNKNAVTARVSRRERHRNQRPAPASGRAPALARPGSEGAGRPGAQRRCAGHLRTTHPVDAAGDRRCRRNRRGGAAVPAEEMIAPQPHTGGLSAPNPRPRAGPRAGSPRTSVPGRRQYPPGSGSDPARGQA